MPSPFTTLARIRAHNPCGLKLSTDCGAVGYLKLRNFLGSDFADDAPIAVAQIVESNGINDALWCLRSMPEHDSLWRHFAVDCAERVVHAEAHHSTIAAIAVARRFANGSASEHELMAARSAAWSAAWAAAESAARSASRSAAWAAAESAARSAAWSAEVEWQKMRLLALCESGEWSPIIVANN